MTFRNTIFKKMDKKMTQKEAKYVQMYNYFVYFHYFCHTKTANFY